MTHSPTTLLAAFPTVLRQAKIYGSISLWQYYDGVSWYECKDNDPLSDLNAAAACERTLLPHCNDGDAERAGDAQRYELFLIQALKDEDPFLGASMGDLWHASASARFSALLATVTKV